LFLLFPSHAHHRDLHSFPTRRSSDLPRRKGRLDHPILPRPRPPDERKKARRGSLPLRALLSAGVITPCSPHPVYTTAGDLRQDRSEEHTSELQSRENLVCRLLLEKKK